jgi:hypothetical protein
MHAPEPVLRLETRCTFPMGFDSLLSRTRSRIKRSQWTVLMSRRACAQRETFRSATRQWGATAAVTTQCHRANLGHHSCPPATHSLAGTAPALRAVSVMRKSEQLPQMGDVLVSKPTASRDHDVSVIPDAESVIQGPHDPAIASGRELAQRLGVHLWLTEEHIHFLRLATHRDNNGHHTPLRAARGV